MSWPTAQPSDFRLVQEQLSRSGICANRTALCQGMSIMSCSLNWFASLQQAAAQERLTVRLPSHTGSGHTS